MRRRVNNTEKEKKRRYPTLALTVPITISTDEAIHFCVLLSINRIVLRSLISQKLEELESEEEALQVRIQGQKNPTKVAHLGLERLKMRSSTRENGALEGEIRLLRKIARGKRRLEQCISRGPDAGEAANYARHQKSGSGWIRWWESTEGLVAGGRDRIGLYFILPLQFYLF